MSDFARNFKCPPPIIINRSIGLANYIFIDRRLTWFFHDILVFGTMPKMQWERYFGRPVNADGSLFKISHFHRLQLLFYWCRICVLIAVAREIIRETPLPKLVLVFSRPSQIWVFGPERQILLGGAQLPSVRESEWKCWVFPLKFWFYLFIKSF